MFGKSVAVLFSGKAGTGKTTCAKYMASQLLDTYTSIVAPMATGVKQVAYTGFGWDGKKDAKGRKLLQAIGGAGREYNPDIWVNHTFNSIVTDRPDYPFDFVFVDDWRYKNEYAFVKRMPLYNVYTFRLVAPEREILKGMPEYFDSSEVELDDYTFDFTIDNSGSEALLYAQLDMYLKFIIQKEDTFGGGYE